MNGCLVCVSAIETGVGRLWEEGSQLYLSKSDPDFNKKVDMGATCYEKLDPESLPRFSPAESVAMHYELGLGVLHRAGVHE